jgi:hypothetical protein
MTVVVRLSGIVVCDVLDAWELLNVLLDILLCGLLGGIFSEILD